jgi:GNAT superfamily N-acetyltransferase
MVADLSQMPEPDPVPAGIDVREVTDDRSAQQVFELIAWRWNIPAECRPHLDAFEDVFLVGRPGAKVRCWLAWRDGVPVAKCVLHLAAGAAGLYGVVTRPEARGLGLARRLALDSLQAARQAGYSLGVLHATPMAESLYAKLGFRNVAPFRLYSDAAAHI